MAARVCAQARAGSQISLQNAETASCRRRQQPAAFGTVRYPLGTRAKGRRAPRRAAACLLMKHKALRNWATPLRQRSGAESKAWKLAVLFPKLLDVHWGSDIGVVGVHVLDRVDRIDACEGSVQRVLDARSRAIGSVENPPRVRPAALRINQRVDGLLPFFVLHLDAPRPDPQRQRNVDG